MRYVTNDLVLLQDVGFNVRISSMQSDFLKRKVQNRFVEQNLIMPRYINKKTNIMSTGIPRVPLLRWRHWLWIHVLIDGKAECGLWKEI